MNNLFSETQIKSVILSEKDTTLVSNDICPKCDKKLFDKYFIDPYYLDEGWVKICGNCESIFYMGGKIFGEK